MYVPTSELFVLFIHITYVCNTLQNSSSIYVNTIKYPYLNLYLIKCTFPQLLSVAACCFLNDVYINFHFLIARGPGYKYGSFNLGAKAIADTEEIRERSTYRFICREVQLLYEPNCSTNEEEGVTTLQLMSSARNEQRPLFEFNICSLIILEMTDYGQWPNADGTVRKSCIIRSKVKEFLGTKCDTLYRNVDLGYSKRILFKKYFAR